MKIERELWPYILAYKDAGDRLVRDLSGDRYLHQVLHLPISSLYRQFIELSLKDLIFIGNKLLDKPLQWSNDQSAQAGFPITHDLKYLLDAWQQIWYSLDGPGNNIEGIDLPFHELEICIESFGVTVDPFRYPNDTNGKVFFTESPEERHIDVQELRKTVNRMNDDFFREAVNTLIRINLIRKGDNPPL